MERKPDMVSGKESMEKVILASGTIVKLMVTVSMSGEMATNMKGNGSTAWEMEMDLISSLMVMFLLANTLMENQKASGSTNGQTVATTQVSLLAVSNTATVNGRKSLPITAVTLMKESIRMIKSTDKVYSNGKVVTDTLDSTTMMNDKAKEKWFGLTEVDTEASGELESSMELE
jgi:hypothetical protein